VAFAVARIDGQPDEAGAESRLIALARSGDLEAFERLVVLNERRVFALALRLTGNAEDAQDATQEAFLRLYRKLGQIDSGRSVGPWLYTVTVNACRDIGRRQRRSRLVAMDHWVAAAPADPSGDPERLYSGAERERELREALAQLPERERAALLLREMNGMSTEEVAAVLGSSATTVRSQVSNARLKLRKLLGRERTT